MRAYRVYRMKESPRQQFRWAPHVSGCSTVKRKDYDENGSVQAPNEYAVWQHLRASEAPLQVGDVLETDAGQLLICKYVGFEPAQWWMPPTVPETPPPGPETAAGTSV